MSQLLGFTDEEITTLTALASPLPPQARDRFRSINTPAVNKRPAQG